MYLMVARKLVAGDDAKYLTQIINLLIKDDTDASLLKFAIQHGAKECAKAL